MAKFMLNEMANIDQKCKDLWERLNEEIEKADMCFLAYAFINKLVQAEGFRKAWKEITKPLKEAGSIKGTTVKIEDMLFYKVVEGVASHNPKYSAVIKTGREINLPNGSKVVYAGHTFK